MDTNSVQNIFARAVLYTIGKLEDLIRHGERLAKQMEESSSPNDQAGITAGTSEEGQSDPGTQSRGRLRGSDKTHVTSMDEKHAHQESGKPEQGDAEGPTLRLTHFQSTFVTAHDGEGECAALLLNRFVVEALQNRRRLDQTKKRLHKKITTLQSRVRTSKRGLQTSQGLVENRDVEMKDPNRARSQPSTKQGELQDAEQEISRTEKEIRQIDTKIRRCHFTVFSNLDFALEEAGFIKTSNDQAEPKKKASAHGSPQSASSRDALQPSTSSSQFRRYEADKTLDDAETKLDDAEESFLSRQTFYYEQKQAWREARDNDQTSVSSAGFDRWYFLAVQTMSQQIKDAEANLKEAKRKARELGVLRTDENFGFRTFSQQSYGYADSVEQHMASNAPFEKIEAWIAEIENDDAKGYEEALETLDQGVQNDVEMTSRDVDDWAADIQSVGCGSSIGVLDDGPNREWIDRWQEMCERKGR